MTGYIGLLFAVLQMVILIVECANFRRVCYYASWSKWRPGAGKFLVSDIDPHLCTHIIFAFAGFDKGTSTLTTPTRDERTMYAQLNALKTKNPQLITLLAVGGWNAGSESFSRLTGNPTKRSDFVAALVKQVKQYDFDGVDIDWEYPQSVEDKNNYVVLLKDLYSAFKHSQVQSERLSDYLIACAVPVTQYRLQFYDVPGMTQYVNFFNVMTYDYHGSWEKHTGYNSPLFKRKAESHGHATFNTDWAMRHWVKLGTPKEKLNLGIATYGRSWILNSVHLNGIGAPANKPGQGQKYSQEAGILSYYEICTKLPGGKKLFDSESRVPYFVDGTLWVSYDSPRSVTEKAQYVKTNNIGGVMFWTIDFDDFNNQCGGGKYPLLCSVNNVLEGPSASCSGTVSVKAESGRNTANTGTSGGSDISKSLGLNSVVAGSSNANACTDGLHRLENDCSGYYQCSGGVKYDPQHCPKGLLFHDQHKYCDWPYNVDCKNKTN
ncbi:acidic mammalian chitinase-like [Gigantopelta aegis]|uniref:acidic mammalian chitinase-like n=1 Tax=Gigantopelta aegis TaxID=1735272 RepID=UPI001B888DD3|nr:acidic mammalian chitinase-like [Gigantopelta aegis]